MPEIAVQKYRSPSANLNYIRRAGDLSTVRLELETTFLELINDDIFEHCVSRPNLAH